MLNQPVSFLNFSTTPGNPTMPNQPAPIQNYPHPHQIPPTYRSNTPAPPQQNMHRPPPPNPNQAPPPNTTPTNTAKPTNPTPAPKKPHPQNLLVDVAETVELCFPYKDVAARHGVTPAKVAEALSGVVLLPLLRVAGDKRRAGKLAQERMREYREVRGVVGQQGQGLGEGGMGGLREMAWVLEGGGGNGGGGGSGGGNGR